MCLPVIRWSLNRRNGTRCIMWTVRWRLVKKCCFNGWVSYQDPELKCIFMHYASSAFCSWDSCWLWKLTRSVSKQAKCPEAVREISVFGQPDQPTNGGNQWTRLGKGIFAAWQFWPERDRIEFQESFRWLRLTHSCEVGIMVLVRGFLHGPLLGSKKADPKRWPFPSTSSLPIMFGARLRFEVPCSFGADGTADFLETRDLSWYSLYGKLVLGELLYTVLQVFKQKLWCWASVRFHPP